MDYAWLCDFRGMIYPIAFGAPSYAGSYRLVYFEDFKVLQFRTPSGEWKYVKIIPHHIRGVYSAAKYAGL